MNSPELGDQSFYQNSEEVYDLKVAALSLLFESPVISREVQMEIQDIFNKAHIEKSFLVSQLSHFLSKKNQKIFDADALMKQGHTLKESVVINALNLSDEDKALLEWYQEVRA
jgi:hypothetical protein